MNLAALLPLIERALPEIPSSPNLTSLGIPEPAKAGALAGLARLRTGVLVVIVPRSDRAAVLAEELTAWLGSDDQVTVFPEQDTVSYQHVARDVRATEQRLEVLRRLASDAPPKIIVASSQALAQGTIAPVAFAGATETLRSGDRLPMERFVSSIQERGYTFEPLVESPGEASRRGGIIDIFPPAAERPVRIELLGDTIDSLRSFDPVTQRSLGGLREVQIGPAQEVLSPNGRLAELTSALDLTGLPSDIAAQFQDEFERLGEGDLEAGGGFWLPFLTSATLIDHLPDDAVLVVDEPGELEQALAHLDQEAEEAREVLVERGRIPRNMPLPHIDHNTLMAAIDARAGLALRRWTTEQTRDVLATPFDVAGAFGGRLRNLSQEVIARMRAGWRVVIVSQQSARLAELFRSEGLDPAIELNDPPPAGSLRLVTGSLPHGWSLKTGGDELLLLTDNEIFGFSKQRRVMRPARTGREAFLAELSPGDYVVHIEHGIARFGGLVNRSTDGVEREYLELNYAEGDKLYVPSDQIGRVSRYVGPGEHAPGLTRLSTQEWARAKERVRRAVTDLAQELLNVYAAREALPGHAFNQDSPWQQELEAAFPYIETPDQLAALSAIKHDMETGRPMDRVIVGDVGYGKTELALRAAFKAVMEGMQVAVLVPTTVLAQQHLQTFTERLGAFPTRVEALSRFRSEAEQRRIIHDLAEGTVDIVIGTHRLLQKDVQFKNLGLMIIDEEQRFGVAHKERFKKLRSQVDVLTLSATPIPRTLHMTLSGIRDMSTIQTAPEERLPISTYVAEWDDRLVREAILHEQDRGGQIYLVHNRVHNIEEIAARIRRLVPEVAVAVGHGQMPEEQLERVMVEFARGDHDVLICTTIIESGLDIPNVNTIIINQADRLGLAQLYQLRGRVGRGANRAYAYLLYDRNRSLSEAAQKRLQTIFEASELGAGFQIALKDLEIRGAGNLLGSEQSGHIGAVGYDLYSRMLEEAVRRLRAIERGEQAPLSKELATSVTVDLPLAARIPESYIADLNLRLAVYQRLAGIETAEEAEALLSELDDRFGAPPPPVRNLLAVVRLRALSRDAGIVSILSENSDVVLRSGGPIERRDRLMKAAGRDAQVGTAQIRLPLRGDTEEWMERISRIVEAMVLTPGPSPNAGRGQTEG
jgi:transcription-repair coupling factor (superfamily II helicase)